MIAKNSKLLLDFQHARLPPTFTIPYNHPFAFNFPTSTTHNHLTIFAPLRSRFFEKKGKFIIMYTVGERERVEQHMKQTSLSGLFIYVHFSVTMTTSTTTMRWDEPEWKWGKVNKREKMRRFMTMCYCCWWWLKNEMRVAKPCIHHFLPIQNFIFA